MTVAAIRKKLKTYVDDLDDKKATALYTLLADDIEASGAFTLSTEEIAILDKEYQLHIEGKSKSYSWEEAKEIIRGKKHL